MTDILNPSITCDDAFADALLPCLESQPLILCAADAIDFQAWDGRPSSLIPLRYGYPTDLIYIPPQRHDWKQETR